MQAEAMPGAEILTPWAQFGLSGLVIGMLALYLWFLTRAHREERKEDRDFHAALRKESDDRSVKSFDSLSGCIKELTVAIRENRK